MSILKTTSNKSKRTFTIRQYCNGKLYSKYRTARLSKCEFEEFENNTESDWCNFLRYGSYIQIK